MEAMVNELFGDARDSHGLTGDGYLAALSPDTVRLVQDWWKESDGGASILTKYQLLLSFAGEPRLDKGSAPYQPARLLVGLRNSLVHYSPETVQSHEHQKLEKQLEGRFPSNRLIGNERRAQWPHGLLGAGCAKWAWQSAQAPADGVTDRLQIKPNYRRSAGDSK